MGIKAAMRLLIYLVFFLSGVAALVYEISWSRQFGLLFGHTVHASSIVLASYFAGMAIGYWLGARWSSRVNPMVGYAIAEIIAGLWALLIPSVMMISETTAIAPWLSHLSVFWQTTSRAVFCFALLMPATIALGATLPMIAVGVSGSRGGISNRENAASVTFAYALNTAGAFCGVLCATWYLMMAVGVGGSSYCAVALSFICAAIAFCVRHVSQPDAVDLGASNELSHSSTPTEVIRAPERAKPFLVFTLAALSGFAVLALQIFYTRMFSLVFHNSTYTFGNVIAVFLAALSVGGMLAALALRYCPNKSPQKITGFALAVGALWTVGSVWLFTSLTDLEYFRFGNSFVSYMCGVTGLVMIVVGPGITLLGMVLPLVWHMAGASMETNLTGSIVGKFTSINTIAAALGAAVASFIMLPMFGLWASIVATAAVLFAVGVLMIRPFSFSIISIMTLLMICLSAISINSPTDSVAAAEGNEKVLRRWNSAYGWIDVVQQGDSNTLKIRQNLHYRFGKTGGNAREYRQAHLPLLLHPNPKSVMFMGLGTGLTAGGAVPHPEVEQIAVAELIPEVIEATRMLKDYNFNIIDHPKSTVYTDDARHALLASEANFDVIVSDLFVPWESETGYLYTVEHYQTAARRLNAGGIFCQWLPMYQLGTEEFEMIANSFASVFPKVTLWWGKLSGSRSPVIAFVGSQSEIELDTDQLQTRLETLDRVMGSTDPSIVRWDLLVDHYAGDWESPPNAVLNTDEFPRVEFSTPVSNRDKKMIHSFVLEDYFENVLTRLQMKSLKIDGVEFSQPTQQRNRQRIFIFGGR